jgi:hypothetical protein
LVVQRKRGSVSRQTSEGGGSDTHCLEWRVYDVSRYKIERLRAGTHQLKSR